MFSHFIVHCSINKYIYTDQGEGKHPYQEKEPLEAWPNDINPHTGEIGLVFFFSNYNDTSTEIFKSYLFKGGPRGPEPTRYGDWERKGRCTDF